MKDIVKHYNLIVADYPDMVRAKTKTFVQSLAAKQNETATGK